jgi:hypothetical protein
MANHLGEAVTPAAPATDATGSMTLRRNMVSTLDTSTTTTHRLKRRHGLPTYNPAATGV